MSEREHLIKFTRRFIMNQHREEQKQNHHDQSWWFSGNVEAPITGYELANSSHICGTTGCVAGWGALFAGYVQIREAYQLRDGFDPIENYGFKDEKEAKAAGYVKDHHGNWWNDGTGYNSTVVVNPANGELYTMAEAARIEFGLSEDQSRILFAGDNSYEMIDKLVDAFLADQNVNLLEVKFGYAYP